MSGQVATKSRRNPEEKKILLVQILVQMLGSILFLLGIFNVVEVGLWLSVTGVGSIICLVIAEKKKRVEQQLFLECKEDSDER